MTKSSPKIGAGEPRDTRRRTAPKVAPMTAGDLGRKTASKVAAQRAGDAHGETAPKVTPEKAVDSHRHTAPKVAPEKAVEPKTTPKSAADKSGYAHRSAPKVATERARDTFDTTTIQSERSRDQVPDSMSALAARSVAQTRELYERSKNALQAVVESWEKSLGGAVALNRKIIDIAERNVASSFDLATELVGAKNLPEAVELQTAYWRKQFNDLRAQAEEVRALSTEVSVDVAEPIKGQLTPKDE